MVVSRTRILLVDDDEADVFHFQRLGKKCGLASEIVVARSGDDALALLRRNADEGQHFVIVTDLNMPGMTGHELIEEVRADDRLASSVIFVISTSDLPDDLDRAYERHVAGYIIKDEEGAQLSEGVQMLSHYLKAVTLH
jgi:hypothetical protein